MTTRYRALDPLGLPHLTPLPLAEAALRLIDDGLAIIDSAGRIAFANSALERLIGVDAGALVSSDAADALRPLASNEEGLRAGIAARRLSPRRVERALNGRVASIELSLQPIDGEYSLLRAKDISARIDAERRAYAQEEENESFRIVACLLAEESDIPEVLKLLSAQAASQCDADGATVIQVQDARGRAVATVGMLSPLQHREFNVLGSLAERAIRTRSPVAVADFLGEFPNHPWTDAAKEVNAGPILFAPLFAHDTLLGIVTVSRLRGREPFTRKEIRRIRALADQAALAMWKSLLLERAEEANRAKNDFIAVMSHELRTPLAAVTGYEELLADEILGSLNEEQHNAIDRMRWSTRLLGSIIEEILTFSRLETGDVQPSRAATSVAELLTTVAAVLEPLVAARGLRFDVQLPDAALEIDTDPDLVRRVLVNLGSNAVKFTKEGVVELFARVEERSVALVVRDTGIGIAASDLKRIFEAFTQVHSGTARPYGGTGLGLHTAHRLARLVGGEISVESTEGQGSTFTLRLPLRSLG